MLQATTLFFPARFLPFLYSHYLFFIVEGKKQVNAQYSSPSSCPLTSSKRGLHKRSEADGRLSAVPSKQDSKKSLSTSENEDGRSSSPSAERSNRLNSINLSKLAFPSFFLMLAASVAC
mmetsp:Transcript_30151/g.77895  ORF Transcript_30151/g.77895 Transcript_30151/m.77895 type:complete len:119 (-) Transcript_30151:1940-2296(-)